MSYDVQEIYNILVPRGYYKTLFGITNPPQFGDAMICCPFHGEKTPSFSVSTTKPFYHCFGGSCGKQGDWINFLQELNGWDFKTSVEFLAKEAGVSENKDFHYKTKEIKSYTKEKKVNTFTEEQHIKNVLYFVECLENIEKNPILYDIFSEKRGISVQTLKDVGLAVNLELKEWIIPVYSIKHINKFTGLNCLIGFERRKGNFSYYLNDNKEMKCMKSFGTPSLLASINTYSPRMKELIILEGFLDAWSYYDYLLQQGKQDNVYILSPSCGLKKLDEYIADLDTSSFDIVNIMLDNDKPGLEMMKLLNSKFPQYNYINLPDGFKDFGEYWKERRTK